MVYLGGLDGDLEGDGSPSQLSCSVPELLTCDANPLSPRVGRGLELLVVEDTESAHGETDEGGVSGSGDGECSRESGSAGVARAESLSASAAHGASSSPLSLLLSAKPFSAGAGQERRPSAAGSSRQSADNRSSPVSEQSLEPSFTYRESTRINQLGALR